MEETKDTEVISCFTFYCWSVSFPGHFSFKWSWISDVCFFSCDSKIFILRPPYQHFSYTYRKWVGGSPHDRKWKWMTAIGWGIPARGRGVETQVNLESVCICGWERRRKKPPARLRKINNMRNMRMHATWETCLFKKYDHRHGNIVIIGSYIHRTSIHALILLG